MLRLLVGFLRPRGRSVLLASVLALAVTSAHGCLPSADCERLRSCAPSGGTPGIVAESSGGARSLGEGGADGEGGAGGLGGAEQHCDAVATNCAREAIVHVSPKGDDSDWGSRAAPVQTVARALALVAAAVAAGEDAPPVYLCATEGAYAETLTIGPEHGTVWIEGGFDCESFAASEERALLQAENSRGHRVEEASGVTLRNLVLSSPNAGGSGTSSYGLWVVESAGVRIQRSDVIAGEGAAGDPGMGFEATDRAEPGAEGRSGSDACEVHPSGANVGGQDAITYCGGVATVSVGGKGGAGGGGILPAAGLDADHGAPDGGTRGLGETGGDYCTKGGNGSTGSTGDQGKGSEPLGYLSSAGLYMPPVGGNGGPGTVGKGGGGGGGAAKPSTCETGASGGSGGGGGCPGAGGLGGKGGGGSFGLVIIASEAQFFEVTVSVALGGSGGAGGDGQMGGDSGDGADGGTYGPSDGNSACYGGDGGRGGNGGSGAGGSGGPSIAVVYTGGAPQGIKNLIVMLPEVGAAGGPGGISNETGNGQVGVVQAVWTL